MNSSSEEVPGHCQTDVISFMVTAPKVATLPELVVTSKKLQVRSPGTPGSGPDRLNEEVGDYIGPGDECKPMDLLFDTSVDTMLRQL